MFAATLPLPRLHPLALSIACLLLLASPASATTNEQDSTVSPQSSTSPHQTQSAEAKPAAAVQALPVIRVLGVLEPSQGIAVPYDVISHSDIVESGATTLGQALEDLPGVHADSFGAGASRPVIRGQTAPRVKVLSNGSAVVDASQVSPDHAVAVNTLLGERMEVLRGPSTLLYGGGAIGGVVNVVDNKVPSELPEGGSDGQLMIRGNSVARGRAFGGAISQQLGDNLVLHAQTAYRDADNYKAPGLDEPRVDASFSESSSNSVGLSWVTDKGHVGVAYSYRSDRYGLPGHSHEYEACHPHGSHLHCGSHDHDHDHDHDHNHDHGHDEQHLASIDLVSRRIDVRGGYLDPFPGIEQIRFRASYTDYQHDELEGDSIGTRFSNEGYNGRVELQHVPLGNWSGIFGAQYADTRFAAQGEEAFLPSVDTRSTGLFVVEHYDLNEQWHFELGARHESLKHSPRSTQPMLDRGSWDGTANSVSSAAVWSFQPGLSLTLSASHAERMPSVQELYARGIHLATNTYECGMIPHPSVCGGIGDHDFGKETSRNFELRLRKHDGDLTYLLSVYINRVSDYIYAKTLDQHEAFRLVRYSQADAEFRGFEAQVDYRINDMFSIGAFADRVHATFDEGGYLPRIPPSRYGLHWDLRRGGLHARIKLYHVNNQDEIATYEVPSPSWNMLDANLSYALDDGRTRLFLHGSNLLDEQIWNHASFLASSVPLPGRNFTVGVLYRF